MQVFLPLIRKSDRKKCTTQQKSHWMNIFILIHILIICNNILIINILRLYHCLLTYLVNFSWPVYCKISYRDCSGDPVVKSSLASAGDMSSIPGRGAKIPHASIPKKKQNIKQKQYCNKVNKDFKNGPHRKILKRKKRI